MINTEDDFVKEIWYYSSDRIDGRTKVKDACAVSHLSEEDFANYTGKYIEPIKSNYRDYSVIECPPNGQGIAALMALTVRRVPRVRKATRVLKVLRVPKVPRAPKVHPARVRGRMVLAM